jgi:hypothetical protein
MIDCSGSQARNPPCISLCARETPKKQCLCAHACVMYAHAVKWRTNREIAITPVFVFLLGRCRWSAQKPPLFPQDRKSTHCSLLGQVGANLVGAAYRIKFAFSLSRATNIKFGPPTLQLFGCVPPSCERVLISQAEEIRMCQTCKVSVVLTAEMQIIVSFRACLHYHFCTTDLHSASCSFECLLKSL